MKANGFLDSENGVEEDQHTKKSTKEIGSSNSPIEKDPVVHILESDIENNIADFVPDARRLLIF